MVGNSNVINYNQLYIDNDLLVINDNLKILNKYNFNNEFILNAEVISNLDLTGIKSKYVFKVNSIEFITFKLLIQFYSKDDTNRIMEMIRILGNKSVNVNNSLYYIYPDIEFLNLLKVKDVIQIIYLSDYNGLGLLFKFYNDYYKNINIDLNKYIFNEDSIFDIEIVCNRRFDLIYFNSKIKRYLHRYHNINLLKMKEVETYLKSKYSCYTGYVLFLASKIEED